MLIYWYASCSRSLHPVESTYGDIYERTNFHVDHARGSCFSLDHLRIQPFFISYRRMERALAANDSANRIDNLALCWQKYRRGEHEKCVVARACLTRLDE